jgi:hypothetical protein
MPKSQAELESSAAIAQAVHAVKTALAVLEAQKPSQKKPNKTTIEPPPARKVKRVKAAAGLTKRSHRGFRGLPPPPVFDLEAMPAANLLTEYEAASATRLSTSTLAAWRKRPDHPLQWVKIGTRVRYRAGSVRQFIASGQRPQVGRPRKKDAASAPKRKPRPGTPTATTKIYTEDAAPERRRAPRRPRAAEAAAPAEAE